MATSQQPCIRCNGLAQVAVVETTRFGELAFSRSIRCPSCGYAEEQDGLDASEELRQHVAEAEGVWQVAVSNGSERTTALGISRKLFGYGIKIVKQLREFEPLCVGIGTRTEMEWLERELTDAGIESIASRVEAVSPSELPSLRPGKC